MVSAQPRPKLLVIAGETASGKSALAMRIAKELNGEIIAADSWTVYKGFDIGTSKPGRSDKKAVKHWLLDVREANQGFNAPLFKELAENAIKDIQNRGKLPILVGGTGLYIDSVLYDFGFLPSASPQQRAGLNAMDIPRLLKRAEELKLDLSGIDIRNKRRIIRAIEAKGEKPTKKDMKPGTLIIGLNIGNEELRRRIQQRTQQMISAGLEREVKQLAGKYGWEAEPMKGIGYREWRDYFEGTQTLEATISRIDSATMNLAKRQRTWFKRNPDIIWFDTPQKAYGYLTNRL